MARKRNQNTTADNQVEVTTENTDAEMAAIEAMLAEGGDLSTLEVSLDEAPADDAELLALQEELEQEAARGEAYAAQNSNVSTDGSEDESDPAEAPETSEIDITDENDGAKEKKVAGAKKGGGRTPRPKGSLEDVAAQMFAAAPACFDTEEGELSEDQLRQVMRGVTQKKVQEKVLNMLQHVNDGAKLSVYTELAVNLLVKAYLDESTVSLADIKKAYEDKGYKSGTVGAQSGQMMALFPVLSMATKPERGTLKPNPNSVILDMLASQ